MLGQLRLAQELVEVPGPEAGLVGQLGRVDDGIDRPRRAARSPGRRLGLGAGRSPSAATPASTSRRPFTGPPPARAAPARSISSTVAVVRRGCRAPGGSRRGRSRARPARPGPRCAASDGTAPAAGTPSPANAGSSSLRAQVEDQAGRGLAAHARHRAQRREVLVHHGSDQVGGRQRRQDGERQRGPDPVGAEQRLEAARSSAVGEPVEHDGVLADVGVHVQRQLGARLAPAPRARTGAHVRR